MEQFVQDRLEANMVSRTNVFVCQSERAATHACVLVFQWVSVLLGAVATASVVGFVVLLLYRRYKLSSQSEHGGRHMHTWVSLIIIIIIITHASQSSGGQSKYSTKTY